jgi:hypothetical protein
MNRHLFLSLLGSAPAITMLPSLNVVKPLPKKIKPYTETYTHLNFKPIVITEWLLQNGETRQLPYAVTLFYSDKLTVHVNERGQF